MLAMCQTVIAHEVAAVDDAEDTTFLDAFVQAETAHKPSKLAKIEARQRKLIKKEMAKPVHGSYRGISSHHRKSAHRKSVSAADSAAKAAARAVHTLSEAPLSVPVEDCRVEDDVAR